MTDTIKQKFKKLLIKWYRKQFINMYIPKIGNIVEEEDKITCYVTQKLLEKNGKRVFYKLHCNGFNTYNEEIVKKTKFLKLNKPVYYIFDGIKFDTAVEIASNLCNIIFRNCTFSSLGIGIMWADCIIFENNKYLACGETYGYGDSYMYGNCMDELTFINDQFVDNREKKYISTNFGIKIKEVKKINIINSSIIAESNGEIRVKAKETNIINSTIKGPNIHLQSDSINDDNCKIIAEQGIVIENKNEDFNCLNIESPIFFYNNEDLSIKKFERRKLYEIKLIDILKNLRDYCNQVVVNERQEELKEIFGSENVAKTLKK